MNAVKRLQERHWHGTESNDNPKIQPNAIMKIKLLDIDAVQLYDCHPRINDGAVDAVAASLREFGFRQPIVVDSDNVIIVGHVRYKAAKKMGLQKIPVHTATNLTPEQVRAYRIADNKTNELSNWDFLLLEAELEKIGDVFTGFEESMMFDEVKFNNIENTMESIEGIVRITINVEGKARALELEKILQPHLTNDERIRII
jgi:hypothetical protein